MIAFLITWAKIIRESWTEAFALQSRMARKHRFMAE
jgi:hypothetical protein